MLKSYINSSDVMMKNPLPLHGSPADGEEDKQATINVPKEDKTNS